MNQSFKEFFYSGELNRLCKVSISQGDKDFTHEMSAFWFRSGFKISIENDINLTDTEINEISKYVLTNHSFIRQLMAMGFDTLIIQGANNGKGRKFSLKASLLSGEDSPKQLLLINTQLVTRIIKFFD